VDPLIAAIMAAIASYVSTQTGEILEKVGDAATNKAKAIWTRLKERWSSDENATRELDSFATEPQVYGPVIRTRLETKLNYDRVLRDELSRLVADIGPDIEVFQEIAKAKGVVGLEADEVASGTTRVHQRMTEADDVTGAKVRRIG
jgi:hypothetical protein